MGNEQGKPSGKLGVSAVATICTIQENHVRGMSKKFSKKESDMITKDDIKEEMGNIEEKGIEPVDLELLYNMFTMFDVTGDGNVNYKEFLAGVCLLITSSDKEKLSLAFSVCDSKRTGTVNRTELRRTLTAMKNVVSYFGDPVVRDVELAMIVTEIFKKQPSSTSAIKIEEYFDDIFNHKVMQAFLSGKGKAKFGKGVE